MGYWERRKIKKWVDNLTPDQRDKVKVYLHNVGKLHCLHGVRYDNTLPCPTCLTQSVHNSDLSKILLFL